MRPEKANQMLETMKVGIFSRSVPVSDLDQITDYMISMHEHDVAKEILLLIEASDEWERDVEWVRWIRKGGKHAKVVHETKPELVPVGISPADQQRYVIDALRKLIHAVERIDLVKDRIIYIPALVRAQDVLKQIDRENGK